MLEKQQGGSEFKTAAPVRSEEKAHVTVSELQYLNHQAVLGEKVVGLPSHESAHHRIRHRQPHLQLHVYASSEELRTNENKATGDELHTTHNQTNMHA